MTGGSTATPYFTAPAHRYGEVITLRVTTDGAANDDVMISVLPHALWRWNGTALKALRIVQTLPLHGLPLARRR